MVTIEIKDDQIGPALARLSAHLSNMTPVFQQIGEIIIDSTKKRFEQGVSPVGVPWAPKSPVTIARQTKIDVRPLFGPSGNLHESINIEPGPDGLRWGPGMATKDYAATMHFGAAQGAFGRTKRNAPIPWGNIPARPYLGLSEEDRSNILDCLAEWIEGAIK